MYMLYTYVCINKHIHRIFKFFLLLKIFPSHSFHKLVVFWKFKSFLKCKMFTQNTIVKKVKAFAKGKHMIVIKAQNL